MKFNENLQSVMLKLLFTFLVITYVTIIKAQNTFTICPGEEVVLSGFSIPPPGASGAAGPPGNPQQYPCEALIRSIEPEENIITGGHNSITVAPIFTTTYIVTSKTISCPDCYCIPSEEVFDYFTVNVVDCEATVCNVDDPFVDLIWLNELIDLEDENGFGYYDYIQLHNFSDENYIEVVSELTNEGSQIYTCNGTLFCERQDSLSCSQFNESTLYNTLYNTRCTPSSDDESTGDNKVDIQLIKIVDPWSLYREEYNNFSIEVKNNGPCYLYETDILIEVNGDIIGTEHWEGAISPNQEFQINTELKFLAKPETDYDVRIWFKNQNGNSDLNFANDTIAKFYKGFEPKYNFEIEHFVEPLPVIDGLHPVSISLENGSNTRQAEALYIYWSVNGEEQPPLVVEDYPYNIEEAIVSSQKYKSDTILIGNYFFEIDKDYLIEAWVDLPMELRNPNQPQDKISYFLPANSAKVDLRINDLISPSVQTIEEDGAIVLEIHKFGSISIDEFTIKWFVNEQEQTPVVIKSPNWFSPSQNLTKDEYIFLGIDTFNFDKNTDYELHFIIETSENIVETDLNNNEFTFSYNTDDKELYQADLFVEVCKDDSVELFMEGFHFWHYPVFNGGIGGPPGPCGECTINFMNHKWMLNDEIIDTTFSVTVKPTTNALYRFTADKIENCSGCYTSNQTQGLDDVTIGIVLVDCQKPTSIEGNCENYFGRVSQNYIHHYNSLLLEPYDVNGQALNLSFPYVKFDFELLGPQIVNARTKNGSVASFQPVTITCLEEIGLLDRWVFYEYEVCAGDQIEEVLQIPSAINPNLNDVICSNLINHNANDLPITSYVSSDCDFVFNVEDRIGNERLTYTSKLQIAPNNALELEWQFRFSNPGDCSIFNPYPFLTTFIDPSDCAGKSVYVYDADEYEFIVVKTDLAEILLTTEGKVYCMIPTGGFSFLRFYDSSRIVDSWTCEAGFQGKEARPKNQDTSIQIFPNPTTDKLFINLQALTFEQPVISVYDVQGKQVKQLSSAATFAGIVQLDVGDLERGVIWWKYNQEILS